MDLHIYDIKVFLYIYIYIYIYVYVYIRFFRKCDVEVWTGSIWFRIGTGGGHL